MQVLSDQVGFGNQQRRYWVEKTLVRGHRDREDGPHALGRALWSPQKDKVGRDIYRLMREVKPGDVVLHLVDNRNIVGASLAASHAEQTYEDQAFIGLDGTDWDGMPAQRIALSHFQKLDPPIEREEFLEAPEHRLKLGHILDKHEGLFFNRNFELNQGKYLTEAPHELVDLLNQIYKASTGLDLPHVVVGAFRFVDKDFESCTGKPEDARYLSSRFRELLGILTTHPEFRTRWGDFKTYVARPFNQGSKEYLDYMWLGVAHPKYEKPQYGVQLQVGINPDDPFLIELFVDRQGRDSRESARSNIESKRAEFVELLGRVEGLSIGYYNADQFDVDCSLASDEDVTKIIDDMAHPGIHFYVRKTLKKNDVIARGVAIVDEILNTWAELHPLYDVLVLGKAPPPVMPLTPEQKEEVRHHIAGFLEWLKTEDGKGSLEERSRRKAGFPTLFSRANIDGLSSIDAFKETVRAHFWCARNLRYHWPRVESYGLETIKAALVELIYDELVSLAERIERFIGKGSGLGLAFASELLHNILPNEVIMWNERVNSLERKVLGRPLTRYTDHQGFLSAVGQVLTESGVNVGDYTDVDSFVFYVDEFGPAPPPPPLPQISPDDVKTRLKLPPHVLDRVCAALNAGGHVIVTGPVGTGKTVLGKDVCLAARSRELCDDFVITTASSDWTTFDTIGGYMPTAEGTLEFREGKFLEAIHSNSWLIIDEINRADIDKAFGQLFTVLAGQRVELPFRDRDGKTISIEPVDEGDSSYDTETATYNVGSNWRIVATMNVYDMNFLFDMSYAFMRRFAFIYVDLPDKDDYVSLINEWSEGKVPEEIKEKLLELANLRYRRIGPAIIQDMIRYIKLRGSDELSLAEAIVAYVLPQLQGLEREKIGDAWQNIKGIFTREALPIRVIKPVFEEIIGFELERVTEEELPNELEE